MYDWFVNLIGAPANPDSTVILACCFMCVMLFVVSVHIFINTIFNFFRPQK